MNNASPKSTIFFKKFRDVSLLKCKLKFRKIHFEFSAIFSEAFALDNPTLIRSTYTFIKKEITKKNFFVNKTRNKMITFHFVKECISYMAKEEEKGRKTKEME